MAGLSMPNDTRVSPDGPYFGNVWVQFFAAISRKLTAGSNVTAVVTADASDPATTQALVNELKAKVNLLIEAQQA